jgi:hypothetical protein
MRANSKAFSLLFARIVIVLPLVLIASCSPVQNELSEEELRVFSGMREALTQIAASAPGESAFVQTELNLRSEILGANVKLLEGWRRSDRESKELILNFLSHIERTLAKTAGQDQNQMLAALNAINQTGLDLSRRLGSPYLLDITPSQIRRDTSEPIRLRIRGHALDIIEDSAKVGSERCQPTALPGDVLEIICAGEAVAKFPESPVSGNWAAVKLTMQIDRARSDWIGRIVRIRAPLANVSIPIPILPSFSGTITVTASELDPKGSIRKRSQTYSRQGDQCSDRVYEDRVDTQVSDGWSIDPTSIRIKVDALRGARTLPPTLSNVGQAGFTLTTSIGGSVCVRWPFGGTSSFEGAGFISYVVEWEEVQAKLATKTLLRENLIGWAEEKTAELPATAQQVSIEMRRSDGIVDRGDLSAEIMGLSLPWLDASIVDEGPVRVLKLTSITAIRAPSTAAKGESN